MITDDGGRHAVLFSGGLDSLATTLVLLNALDNPTNRLQLVYVDLGTPYSAGEKFATEVLAREFEPIQFTAPDLRDVGGYAIRHDSPYIPYRNLFLAAACVAHMEQQEMEGFDNDEPYTIWMGGLRDDNVADKTPEAFNSMSMCLSALHNRDVFVRSLWWNHAKPEMVAEMHEAHGKQFVKLARMSISCYRGDNCGECQSCFRKWIALEGNGIQCTSWFRSDPRHSAAAAHYRDAIYDPKYDPVRREVTLTVLDGGLKE